VELQDHQPLNFDLVIDAWKGTSNGEDQAQQVTAMKNFFNNNKFQNMYVNTPNIAAAIVLILSAGLAFLTPYALVATALAAGFLAFRVWRAIKAYPKRVSAALSNLDKCMGEIAEFKQYFTENRKKKDDALRLLETI
jgi:hypothetical protein